MGFGAAGENINIKWLTPFLFPFGPLSFCSSVLGVGLWVAGGLAAFFLIAMICGIMLPELVDGRFRTYKQFYHDIQVGMSRDQVFAAMDLRYAKNPDRKPPKTMNETATFLGSFMNPEASREPNCEGIFLTLRNGIVVEKDYSPD